MLVNKDLEIKLKQAAEKGAEKKKILLVYPQLGPQALMPQAPLSLLSICPNLEEAGYVPVIVDTRVEADYQERIRTELRHCLFVGITSMTGLQIQYALEMAEFVRSIDPTKVIVWGGIHATILPEQTLRDPRADIVVAGEGEEVVVELVDCLSSGGDLRTVKGIYFQDEHGAPVFTGPRPFLDMNKVKMPSWHLVDVSKYSEIGVQTARGCPFRCRFCFNYLYNGKKWRAKHADIVIKELRVLKERYNVGHIVFYDDNFFSNLKRVRYLCEKIIEDKIDIKWSTTCRADILARRVDGDFAGLMKKAGVHILFVGSESGSQRILTDVINKQITVNDILGMARTSREYGLRIHTSFMAGFPGETEGERLMTFDLMDRIKDINPDIYITAICIYTPYPGNPLFDEIVSERSFEPPGSLQDWAQLTFFNCKLPWLTEESCSMLENLAFISRFVFWYKEIKERYIKFYHYPAYMFFRLDALLRWKLRFFTHAPEWKLFRKIVGYTEA
ncbi:MAG TPA: radical SAM protein [Syntrophales bacterium]|nr:radical SAM protein [Syntrophales bacterium]